MPKPREFEKPIGVRDFPPRVAARKRMIEKRVEARFRRWGYREIITPTLEYFDTVGGASAIEEHKLFKLLDREGKTLVLRPDQTAPIARVVASLMRKEPLPLRLYYHANVFRAQENEAGRNAEFFQSGVELVGDASPEADAEVITLAVEALQACEIEPLQLVVGHIGLLDGLLQERLEDARAVDRLKECLGRRNLVEYRDRVKAMDLNQRVKEELMSILEIRGDRSQLNRLRAWTRSERVESAVRHLEAVWEALGDMGSVRHVVLDLSLVGSLDYYTGMYFEGYGSHRGIYLVSGGRYDRLMEQFDRPASATGFALKTDRLMLASPASANGEERIALVYSRKLRKKAFEQARALREEGKSVSLLSAEETRNGWLQAEGSLYDRVIRVKEGEDV